MLNVVVFCNSASHVTSNILLEALLKVSKNSEKFNIKLIVDTSSEPQQPSLFSSIKLFLTKIIIKTFNPKLDVPFKRIIFTNIYAISKQYGYSVHIPFNGNINSEKFITTVEHEYKSSLALVIGCPQLFKALLIDKFDMIINYHNSYLPYYKGLEATSWAYYHGEKSTGFTYHMIDENIDAGNIIYQKLVPIDFNKSQLIHEIEKTEEAARHIQYVIDCVIMNERGKIQGSKGSYFGKNELNSLININDFSNYSYKDICKILMSFPKLNLKIGAGIYPVTAVNIISKNINNKSKWIFKIRDEKFVRITRINYLPTTLYNLIYKASFVHKVSFML